MAAAMKTNPPAVTTDPPRFNDPHSADFENIANCGIAPGRLQCNDADPVAVGQGHRFGLIEDDRVAGLNGKGAAADSVHGLDGRAPDSRHVKASILLTG